VHPRISFDLAGVAWHSTKSKATNLFKGADERHVSVHLFRCRLAQRIAHRYFFGTILNSNNCRNADSKQLELGA
jgi:hypothetical protein